MHLPFAHHQLTSQEMSHHEIGEEATLLKTLMDAHLPVPKGFIVAPHALEEFFTHHELGARIQSLLERCNFADIRDVAIVSKAIKKLIMQSEIPESITRPLLDTITRLPGQRFMVTSSPIPLSHEHATPTSVTQLFGIDGEANVVMALRELYSSLFDPEYLYARHTVGFTGLPRMAVCIQVQPSIRVSGLLTTTDEETNDKHTAVVMAVWGEGALQHQLDGHDTYWVNKDEHTVTREALEEQRLLYSATNGQLTKQSLSPAMRGERKLTSANLRVLAQLAHTLQQHLFFPQEIMWGFDGSSMFILSVKRLTSPLHTMQPHAEPKETQGKHPTLVTGIPITPGIVTGKARVVTNASHNVLCKPGDIAIVQKLSVLHDETYKHIRGIVCEEEHPVSRGLFLAQEYGVALLVGARDATVSIQRDRFITIHSPSGRVLSGSFAVSLPTIPTEAPPVLHTPEIMPVMKIGTIAQATPLTSRLTGHVFIDTSSVVRKLGHHPLKMHREKRLASLTRAILTHIKHVETDQPAAPLLFGFSNFQTHEYRSLVGGDTHERLYEENPLLGFSGSARLLHMPELIEAEFEAIASRLAHHTTHHMALLLPKVRTAYEVARWHKLLSSVKLERSAVVRYVIDVSTPSMIWQIEEATGYGIDGVYLNLDTLVAHIFAIDPRSDAFVYEFADLRSTVLDILTYLCKRCQDMGVSITLAGKLSRNDEVLALAVEYNVREIICPQSALAQLKERLLSLEAAKVDRHVKNNTSLGTRDS